MGRQHKNNTCLCTNYTGLFNDHNKETLLDTVVNSTQKKVRKPASGSNTPGLTCPITSETLKGADVGIKTQDSFLLFEHQATV